MRPRAKSISPGIGAVFVTLTTLFYFMLLKCDLVLKMLMVFMYLILSAIRVVCSAAGE